MNIFKKIYCRLYQSVFKLAIPVLPYRNPIILNSVKDIPKILNDKKMDKVLIVTDEAVFGLGLLHTLENSLKNNQISYYVYNKTTPNPTVKNVEEAKEIFIKNNCNVIIGFGGGSSIDCAKGVGARIARPRKKISKMEGILKILLPTPFMIAVPTTAGTGSEVTVTTVITDDKTKHKFPISDFSLIPDVAVLDSEITKSLPPHMTATTGMDALTHAIEAYIGRSTVSSTRKDALLAVKVINENLEKAYLDGNDIIARKNMLEAAFCAGRAFSKSYVGYCHAVAHSLGGKYGVPHGLANAVILPYILEVYGEAIYKKAKNIAIAMNIADELTPEKQATESLIKRIREMNENMGIPTKIKGIKKEDIKELSKYAEKEANPLYPVPVLMDKNELKNIYYLVMEDLI